MRAMFPRLPARSLSPWLLTLITILCGGGIIQDQLQRWQENDQWHLEAIAQHQLTDLNRQLDDIVSILTALDQEIQANPEIGQTRLNTLAPTYLALAPAVSNLQLAPDAIVKAIYPLGNNRRAIGHNLLLDDKRQQDVLNAINIQQTVLSGPYKTLQSNYSFFLRKPVFLPGSKGKRFWGFVTAMVEMDRFAQETGLTALRSAGMTLALTHSLNASTLYGDQLGPNQDTLTLPLNPLAPWNLQLAREHQNFSFPILLSYGTLLLLSLSFFYINRHIFSHPSHLGEKLAKTQAKMNTLEQTDLRSGLFNRRSFLKQLHMRYQLFHAQNGLSALIVIRFSQLKQLQLTLSSDDNLQLMQQISSQLRTLSRKTDLLGQLDQDTFGLAIDNFSCMNDVWIAANKLAGAMTKAYPVNGGEVTLQCRFGISLVIKDGLEADVLLSRALIALESDQGLNSNISFFNQSMEYKLLERRELEKQLKSALAKDQFFLVYQPQVCPGSGVIIGFEALLRWRRSQSEIEAPARFIQLAENLDLIQEIGAEVIKQACRAQCAFTNVLGRNVQMSVNLSAKQLKEPSLYHTIKDNILNVGTPPSCFTFEITETTFIESQEQASQTLERLRSFGVRISIDDFGTGYSSLHQLKRLPVDELKIDRSFIEGVLTDQVDTGIAKTIIALANHLQLKVIAEGIETNSQHHFVTGYPDVICQGFFYHRPMEMDQAVATLKRQKQQMSPRQQAQQRL
ncbi:EAL domain-containing protein [Ferrimonas sediminicola]|uniref:EAL domain-containing protein n=1 Tax=Ferrimonas sediminicola TaxID=2569538 RepID=A0A4U1BBH1_9GAMM|nr:EAL domain-containing protein [Ferrimonas sediminicola]TKB48297.1 EAL domain-containing protein [Ferrimonas sediminicola]